MFFCALGDSVRGGLRGGRAAGRDNAETCGDGDGIYVFGVPSFTGDVFGRGESSGGARV